MKDLEVYLDELDIDIDDSVYRLEQAYGSIKDSLKEGIDRDDIDFKQAYERTRRLSRWVGKIQTLMMDFEESVNPWEPEIPSPT